MKRQKVVSVFDFYEPSKSPEASYTIALDNIVFMSQSYLQCLADVKTDWSTTEWMGHLQEPVALTHHIAYGNNFLLPPQRWTSFA